MVNTYIMSPNMSTAPPPGGPINLGHILADPAELVSLNRYCAVPIPPYQLNPVDCKYGFRASRSKLASGDLGVFARALGLVGFSAGVDIHYKKGKNDLIWIRNFETMTFDPIPSYIADSMEQKDVAEFMEECNYEAPVYMVTGIKVGRGVSQISGASNTMAISVDGGLNIPGSPVVVGGEVAYAHTAEEREGWSFSTDFVIGYRLRKIWYDHGKWQQKAHTKKVVMQSAEGGADEPTLTLRSGDDVQPEDVCAETTLKGFEVEQGKEEEVQYLFSEVSAGSGSNSD